MNTLRGHIGFRYFALLLLPSFISPCPQSSNSAGTSPDFFVVVPRATGVKQSVFQGKDQIIYHVETDYPADDVVSAITGRLRQLGWEPLKEDFLNPGQPTSQARGWTYFVDSTTKPPTSVHAWNGEWQNTSHDILVYFLTYKCPTDVCSSTANLHDLRVVAIRVPANLAQEIKSSTPHNTR